MPRITEEPPEPAPEPTQAEMTQALLTQLTSAVTILAQRQAAQPNDQVAEMMVKLSGALERLSESNLAGSKLIADETRRAHRPSNEVVHMRSVFNRRGRNAPDGYVKPTLRCPMMIPWLADNDSLTTEEVLLLNLLESGEYLLKLIDNTKIKVTIKVEYGIDEVTPSRLVMTNETAFNNDNFRLMPALNEMLRQVLKLHKSEETRAAASAVLSDDEEEALIAAGRIAVAA